MTWKAWLFSAKRAWARPFIRWTTIATIAMIGISSLLFLWNIIPQREQGGTLVLHYNIYLGIDKVHPWGWVFLLPGAWLVLSLVDFIFAFGWYQEDPHFSFSLITLAGICTFPCMGVFFYLARMNA
ncbi:hypothetical protein FJZ48_03050 [Candidatus Uhrbacteria bacterium]|nr:hypothetical protein [Candidatus Uhrbacteria bacterium]